MHEFRTLTLSIQLYRECSQLKLPIHLKNQILRSSSSVSLNLSEGRARNTTKDQLRFFNIAIASLRETMTALELANYNNHAVYKLADKTAAYFHIVVLVEFSSIDLRMTAALTLAGCLRRLKPHPVSV